jgi:hypothetical protein
MHSMAIHPDYLTIGSLFSRNHVYCVPRYQRGYSWEDGQIEDFIRDLTACYNARIEGSERHHFFGGIVAVRRERIGSAGVHCDLIDGQQRIASFVLVASCLHSLLEQICEDAKKVSDLDSAKLAKSRADLIRNQYLQFNDEINRKPVVLPRLTLSKPDHDFFAELIQSGEDCDGPRDCFRQSHERLWNAYSAIKEDLQVTVDECKTIPEKLDCLAIVRDILQNDAAVINIITDEEAEAYRLFQVLNDRGTRLSEGDLLRASTLELLGTASFSHEHEAAAVAWDDILRDDPDYTQKFLRWYYASVQGKRPGQSSLFDEFLSDVFPETQMSSMTSLAAKSIVANVKQVAKENGLCRQVLSGDWPYSKSKVKRWERERLKLLTETLDHTVCMPLMLAACKLDEKTFSQIVQATERFAFRAKSICNVHAGTLQSIYQRHAVAIRSSPKSFKLAALERDFGLITSDKAAEPIFRASLPEKLAFQTSSGNKLIKYFLSTLEHYLRWVESGAQGKPECRDTNRILDLTELTVEHIYPQKPIAGHSDSECDGLVNTIGNLTILGKEDNDAVGNKPFASKKNFLGKSPLELNKRISEKASWQKSDIEARAKFLIDAAVKIF